MNVIKSAEIAGLALYGSGAKDQAPCATQTDAKPRDTWLNPAEPKYLAANTKPARRLERDPRLVEVL